MRAEFLTSVHGRLGRDLAPQVAYAGWKAACDLKPIRRRIETEILTPLIRATLPRSKPAPFERHFGSIAVCAPKTPQLRRLDQFPARAMICGVRLQRCFMACTRDLAARPM